MLIVLAVGLIGLTADEPRLSDAFGAPLTSGLTVGNQCQAFADAKVDTTRPFPTDLPQVEF